MDPSRPLCLLRVYKEEAGCGKKKIRHSKGIYSQTIPKQTIQTIFVISIQNNISQSTSLKWENKCENSGLPFCERGACYLSDNIS